VVHVWASPDFRSVRKTKRPRTINPYPSTSLSKLHIRPRVEIARVVPYRADDSISDRSMRFIEAISRIALEIQRDSKLIDPRSGVPTSREERRGAESVRVASRDPEERSEGATAYLRAH